MTDSFVKRMWRTLWQPAAPPCVKAAADAQAEAASRLVRRIENNSRRGLSLTIDRDLTARKNATPNGHAD